MRTTLTIILLSLVTVTPAIAAPAVAVVAAPKAERLVQRLKQRVGKMFARATPQGATASLPEAVPAPEVEVGRRLGYTRTVAKTISARYDMKDTDHAYRKVTETWRERPIKNGERMAKVGGMGSGLDPKQATWVRLTAVRARLETATPTLRRETLPILSAIAQEIEGAEIRKHDVSARFTGKTMQVSTELDYADKKTIKINVNDMSAYGGRSVSTIQLDTQSGELTVTNSARGTTLKELPTASGHATIQRETSTRVALKTGAAQQAIDLALSKATEAKQP